MLLTALRQIAAVLPLYTPKDPHWLTWDWIRTFADSGRRIIAWVPHSTTISKRALIGNESKHLIMPNGQTTERNRWEYYTSEIQEYFTSSNPKNKMLSQTKTRKLLLFVFHRRRTKLGRKILEVKVQRIAPEWKQMNKEELHNLHT